MITDYETAERGYSCNKFYPYNSLELELQRLFGKPIYEELKAVDQHRGSMCRESLRLNPWSACCAQGISSPMSMEQLSICPEVLNPCMEHDGDGINLFSPSYPYSEGTPGNSLINCRCLMETNYSDKLLPTVSNSLQFDRNRDFAKNYSSLLVPTDFNKSSNSWLSVSTQRNKLLETAFLLSSPEISPDLQSQTIWEYMHDTWLELSFLLSSPTSEMYSNIQPQVLEYGRNKLSQLYSYLKFSTLEGNQNKRPDTSGLPYPPHTYPNQQSRLWEYTQHELPEASTLSSTSSDYVPQSQMSTYAQNKCIETDAPLSSPEAQMLEQWQTKRSRTASSSSSSPECQSIPQLPMWKRLQNKRQRINFTPQMSECMGHSAQSFRTPRPKKKPCGFCHKNGEQELVCYSHVLKDSNGIVTCPVLRSYKCNLCGATGDVAHTRKYCPLYASLDFEFSPFCRRLSNGNTTTSFNHK